MKFICAVFDRATQAYGAPFVVPALGHAMRSFTAEVNREHAENMLYNHKEDFELWELGEFDEESGDIKPMLQLMTRAQDVAIRKE